MAALATITGMWRRQTPLDRRELLSQDWRQRVSAEPGVARMRELGQRLLGLLLQHVHTRLNDDHYLAEAKSVGMTYGREAALAHISLSDTVKAFVYFRRACARLTAPASAETPRRRVRIFWRPSRSTSGSTASWMRCCWACSGDSRVARQTDVPWRLECDRRTRREIQERFL